MNTLIGQTFTAATFVLAYGCGGWGDPICDPAEGTTNWVWLGTVDLDDVTHNLVILNRIPTSRRFNPDALIPLGVTLPAFTDTPPEWHTWEGTQGEYDDAVGQYRELRSGWEKECEALLEASCTEYLLNTGANPVPLDCSSLGAQVAVDLGCLCSGGYGSDRYGESTFTVHENNGNLYAVPVNLDAEKLFTDADEAAAVALRTYPAIRSAEQDRLRTEINKSYDEKLKYPGRNQNPDLTRAQIIEQLETERAEELRKVGEFNTDALNRGWHRTLVGATAEKHARQTFTKVLDKHDIEPLNTAQAGFLAGLCGIDAPTLSTGALFMNFNDSNIDGTFTVPTSRALTVGDPVILEDLEEMRGEGTVVEVLSYESPGWDDDEIVYAVRVQVDNWFVTTSGETDEVEGEYIPYLDIENSHAVANFTPVDV